MATNNVNNKVTFWNNVSFTPENVKNNFILNDITGLDNKGIYFNSNKNYPHIIYNGYIYTTGSYISEYTYNNNVDPKGKVNVITNITADPFGKSISYQYTTIDIAYILKKIDELEKQASIKDISDTITLTPDTNNISLVVGESSQAISYSTTSTRLSKVESDNTSIASVSKNDANHTITIKAADELSEDNDNTQTAYIVLTSYSGIIDDKRYTSTEKKIKVNVNKKTQTISNIENEFPVNLTIGGESKELIIDGTYTDLVINNASQNINVELSGTPIKNTITISPNRIGNASISLYAKSSTTYKKSETKKINVTVSDQSVENNYYWYVGPENPSNMGSISPIVDEAVSNGVGFRLLNMDKTYSITNKLYDGLNSPIIGDKSYNWYVLLPQESKLKFYDDLGVTQFEIIGTKDFGDGVMYNIYIRTSGRPVNTFPVYIY